MAQFRRIYLRPEGCVVGSTHYIKNVMDDPGYSGDFWVGGHDHYRSIFFVFPISQPIIEMIPLPSVIFLQIML